jgi:hypothetical protein
MIRLPTLQRLRQVARLVNIVGQDEKQSVPFIFNAEQEELAKACLEHSKVLVVKSRQIGASTFFCFLDSIIALMNPGIKLAIVADTQSKSEELLNRCKQFLESLGISLDVENVRKIRLPNGSEIHALTATGGAAGKESRAGRSLSFQWLHLSELAYWPNQSAYAALLATAGNSPVIIESTAKGTGDLFHRLWLTENEYKKIFFSVESHHSYQADPSLLSDDDWSEAQALGFTSRPHASFWYLQLRNAGGDFVSHLHDYPVIAEHAFSTVEGRWIRTTPEVLEPVETLEDIRIYHQPVQHHKYIASVDTSGGTARDYHVVTVFDRSTRQLVSFWTSNTCTIDSIIPVLQTLDNIYHPDVYLIETNGVGRATYQLAQKAALPIQEIVTTEPLKNLFMLATKKAIESLSLSGPEELALESTEVHINNKGKFSGRKDVCMASGFALHYIENNPYTIPLPRNREHVFHPEDWIKSNNRQWF